MSPRDAICLQRDMSLAGRESNKEFISYRIGEADISHGNSRISQKAAPSGGFFMMYSKNQKLITRTRTTPSMAVSAARISSSTWALTSIMV